MKINEGDKVKLKNGRISEVYSIGLALGGCKDIINLKDGTFCFRDDIEEVLSSAN